MISLIKAAAARRNAALSTGPRTRIGKARASRNALKHGLAVPVSQCPDLRAEAVLLAHLIVADYESEPGLDAAALTIAEAEIDLRRIHAVRAALLTRLLLSYGAATDRAFGPDLSDLEHAL